MSSSLATIAVAVRSRQENPWLDRLLASLQQHAPGLPRTQVVVEEGAVLTKVEKLNRLLRHAPSRYVCLLEDDTQAVHPGWLAGLLDGLLAAPGAALAGPLECRDEPTPEQVAAALQSAVGEAASLPGFCLLVDREADLFFDVRVQTLSDLYLSLLARSRGYRCVRAGTALIRHTKAPWLRDDLAPWEQQDASRFGKDDAYYQQDRHQAKRVRESRLLLDQFGDLARQTLPPELLAVIEPSGQGPATQPGCTKCQRAVVVGEDWVMTGAGPVCLPCRFGNDFVGTLHISEETAAALAAGDD